MICPDPECAHLAHARYCSARCERDQTREDRRSDALERDYTKARLDAATVRGLRTMRSLASAHIDGETDLAPHECAEVRYAIAWVDKQLNRLK